jgi:hypothetical protein
MSHNLPLNALPYEVWGFWRHPGHRAPIPFPATCDDPSATAAPSSEWWKRSAASHRRGLCRPWPSGWPTNSAPAGPSPAPAPRASSRPEGRWPCPCAPRWPRSPPPARPLPCIGNRAACGAPIPATPAAPALTELARASIEPWPPPNPERPRPSSDHRSRRGLAVGWSACGKPRCCWVFRSPPSAD